MRTFIVRHNYNVQIRTYTTQEIGLCRDTKSYKERSVTGDGQASSSTNLVDFKFILISRNCHFVLQYGKT
jgi:hypothetical protein